MNRERVGKLIEENIGLVYKVVSHFYVIKIRPSGEIIGRIGT